MAGLTFTCRRCGVHGSAQVVHELVRTGNIRPVENTSGFSRVDREDDDVDAFKYFQCRLCSATDEDLDAIFTTTTGSAT